MNIGDIPNTAFSVLLLHLFIFHSSVAIGSSQVKMDVYIDRTVKSLENVVDFYEKNFDKVNLDSIYGLRIAEGSVANILNTLPIDHSLLQKLVSLHNRMMNAADKALPYLKEYQGDYYRQFKPMIDKPWSYFQDFRRMENKRGLSKLGHFENGHFNEKISDKCLTEMIGTNAHSKHPCHISFDCLKMMTSSNLRRYGNTHQILYFLLGYQTGCRVIAERKFQKFRGHLKINDVSNVAEFLEKKCEQIFVEMNQLKENLVANGDGGTDLFMEQGLVCSILGYEDFLDHTILKNIFIWQDRELGCFGRKSSYIQVMNWFQKIKFHSVVDIIK
jgi:hypothetical protein